MKERGKELESEYVAPHAINYRFSFTEKERWNEMRGAYHIMFLFINFSGLMVHFLSEQHLLLLGLQV